MDSRMRGNDGEGDGNDNLLFFVTPVLSGFRVVFSKFFLDGVTIFSTTCCTLRKSLYKIFCQLM